MVVANLKVLCGNLPGPVAFYVLGLCSGISHTLKDMLIGSA